MSGEEFLKQKRLDPLNRTTPVVLITAVAGRATSWLVGATAYVSKPFGERELQNAISRAFILNS